MTRAAQPVGRERELETLVDLFGTRDALPFAAVISGDVGIGKTTLWLAAMEAARERDFRLLTSRASETEATFLFAGLFDLVGDVVTEVVEELAPPQRRALEAALALRDAEGTNVDERVVAFAFLNMLRRLARDGPLVLAIDDLQWLDAASLSLLRFALPRLGVEPVATIATVRGDVPAWLRRALPDGRVLVVELGALSMGALHQLLRTQLGLRLPRPTLRRIWEASAGNPFFALEIARAVARRGGVAPGEELPIPSDLESLVDERLRLLSAPAHEVASLVAASTEPTAALVEWAAGRDANRGLVEAIEAGVLELDGERIRFTHPLLASALRRRLPTAARRSLHRRLADVARDPEEQGRHLALATDEPSRDVSSALEAAARSAHRRGAPAAAAELAEQAHRLTPPAEAGDRRRRGIFAADRHVEAGDSRRAALLLEQTLVATPPGPQRAEVLAHLADARALVDGARVAMEVRREALAEAQGDAALELALQLANARDARFAEGIDKGLAYAEHAMRTASVVSDPVLRCRASAVFGLLSFNAGHGIPRDEMDAAIALERSLPAWPLLDGPAMTFGHQLMWSGRLDAARTVFKEAREAFRGRGDAGEGDAVWYLALLEWRAGDWDRAARYAAESTALSEQSGRDAGPRRWPEAIVAAHRGELDHARTLAERELDAARAAGLSMGEAGFEWVLGLLELSAGDAAAAAARFGRARVLASTLGLREPGMAWTFPDELDALAAVGALDEAEATLAPWEERARTLDRPWALAIAGRIRGQVLAARGDLVSSLGIFAAALAEHERDADPFQRARTLLALGAVQRRAKQRRAARATLERALAMFERLPAPFWAARARAELARIGGRAPSGGLTPSEARVAALVSEGRTNKEVAAELFVTERTVEAALTRIYGKLGVRSRTELARRLAPKA